MQPANNAPSISSNGDSKKEFPTISSVKNSSQQSFSSARASPEKFTNIKRVYSSKSFDDGLYDEAAHEKDDYLETRIRATSLNVLFPSEKALEKLKNGTLPTEEESIDERHHAYVGETVSLLLRISSKSKINEKLTFNDFIEHIEMKVTNIKIQLLEDPTKSKKRQTLECILVDSSKEKDISLLAYDATQEVAYYLFQVCTNGKIKTLPNENCLKCEFQIGFVPKKYIFNDEISDDSMPMLTKSFYRNLCVMTNNLSCCRLVKCTLDLVMPFSLVGFEYNSQQQTCILSIEANSPFSISSIPVLAFDHCTFFECVLPNSTSFLPLIVNTKDQFAFIFGVKPTVISDFKLCSLNLRCAFEELSLHIPIELFIERQSIVFDQKLFASIRTVDELEYFENVQVSFEDETNDEQPIIKLKCIVKNKNIDLEKKLAVKMKHRDCIGESMTLFPIQDVVIVGKMLPNSCQSVQLLFFPLKAQIDVDDFALMSIVNSETGREYPVDASKIKLR